jgi:RNA polymerase sigma-70 factor (ECF subfamily)
MGQRDEQSDEAGRLLSRFRDGDMAAFEPFYRIAAPPLRRFIHRRLPSAMSQDTDDLLQEVFIRAYRSAASFRDGYVAGAWLCGIAWHVLIRHLRRRFPILCDPTALDGMCASREKMIPSSDVTLLIQDIVTLAARLPRAQREAFELVYAKGVPQPAAAAHLQCTLPQLRDRLRDARNRLRASLCATELAIKKGEKPVSRNRVHAPRLRRGVGVSQKKPTCHPTFEPQGGNRYITGLPCRAVSKGHAVMWQETSGDMNMLATSPAGKASECALRLSRHFKSRRLSDGRVWLFNTSLLNPIQLDGSDQEAEELLSLLKNGRFNELPVEIVEMLRERGILLGVGVPDLSPEDVLNAAGPAREFRINMSGRIRNLPAMQHGLETLAGYLRSCNPSYERLKVTFECEDLAGGPLRNLVMPHVQWMSRFLPFSEDAMVFCVNLRWGYVAANVGAVRMCLAPSLRLNVVVERAVTDKEIQDIEPLIKRWGFFPNIVIVLNQITSGCAQPLLEKLREQWGDEFQYSWSIPLRVPDRALASYQVMLPSDESIESLLRFIEQHPSLAHQNTLYAALKNQMSSYPAGSRMADGVFIDSAARFAPGTLAARRNPCRLADAETFLSQLPRQRAVRDQLPEPNTLNSRTGVEACEIKCEACPLRHWCGGICAIAQEPIRPSPIDLVVLERLCPIRMRFMTRLLSEAISPVPVAPPVAARFQCGKGRMSIVSSPAALLRA